MIHRFPDGPVGRAGGLRLARHYTRVHDPDRGSTCVYTGTTRANAIQLTATSCSAFDSVGAACASGALRNLRLQTSSITAMVSGTSMTGTEVETTNVIVPGTTTSVGTLTITSAFSATKQ
jgi:hypothetical protein